MRYKKDWKWGAKGNKSFKGEEIEQEKYLEVIK